MNCCVVENIRWSHMHAVRYQYTSDLLCSFYKCPIHCKFCRLMHFDSTCHPHTRIAYSCWMHEDCTVRQVHSYRPWKKHMPHILDLDDLQAAVSSHHRTYNLAHQSFHVRQTNWEDICIERSSNTTSLWHTDDKRCLACNILYHKHSLWRFGFPVIQLCLNSTGMPRGVKFQNDRKNLLGR